MTTKTLQTEKIEIPITGGIFDKVIILGYAERFSHQMGLNFTKVANEMTASTEDNFFQTFNKYFGAYFTLTFVY